VSVEKILRRVCDRCQTAIEHVGEAPADWGRLSFERAARRVGEGPHVDLCPSCWQAFLVWFHEHQKGRLRMIAVNDLAAAAE
jgi:hypothetical protein